MGLRVVDLERIVGLAQGMKATIPSFDQIKQGLQIYEQIERLQNELAMLFGVKSADQVPALLSRAGSAVPAKRLGRPPKALLTGKRGRKKAEESASQSSQGKIETPKKRGRKPGSAAAGNKPKRKISEAHRQAIREAQKRRWAAKKGA